MSQYFYCKILFFLLFTTYFFGQVKQNDLTKLSYEKIKQLYIDNVKLPDKQLLYANVYLNKAQNEKDNRQIARGYYYISVIHKGDKAISYLDSVIKYSTGTNDLSFPIAAYCEKANLLTKKSKHKEALDVFLLAEKYALETNRRDDYYSVEFYIALTKSENLGEVNEALDKYKICYNYLKNKDTKSLQYSFFNLKVLFALADAYKTLHKYDSSTYYNKLGYNHAKINKNENFLALFILNEGANLINKRSFKVGIDSINKGLPKIIKFNDQDNIMAGYYYLGKAYAGLKKKDLAVQNFVKVDSMQNVINTIYPDQASAYTYLIDYYKNKGNKDKQLEYLTKYIKIDDSLQKSHNKMYKLIVKKYDIPHLIKEKETLITILKGNQYYYISSIVVLLFFVSGAIYYGIYQRNLNKKHRERFEKIINNTNTISHTTDIEKEIPEEISKTKSLIVGDELANELLEKLDVFVLGREYLKNDITLQSLSNELGTNSSYLSNIINQYKEKNFVTFVNGLRIDDAVLGLQQNADLKKYTIQAIANEFGFNNAESFSRAFYKRTGLKPSFFIKELEKKSNSNN
jgi:AraC-like DNA-binding protein